MTAVTVSNTITTIEILELTPTILTNATTASVQVTPTQSSVDLNVTPTQVTVTPVPAAVITTQVEVIDSTVTVEIPTLSLSRILDAVRTDAEDTTFIYAGNEVTNINSVSTQKTLTYNPDGTVATLTIATATETVTKTYSYDENGLSSVTVS